ncbi:hypothetical protein [Streptomyces sp. RFCAC02]|uniref:hypothetical protein n=1 Tax=Streptomyces sp. RFCAC02 TaxID=2499143 RepID=UPI00102167FF|nr:hypothetical protein [Streptomyces sp. RFCAC02]
MQLPASPADPTSPRTRPFHWVTTAIALAAVVCAAALIEPSGATARPGTGEDGAGRPAAGPAADPLPGPEADGAPYPLDCGPLAVVVTDRAAVDLDADGVGETVAVVRCDAGSGTPPNGVYLLTAPAADGAPADVATLVDPAEGMTVQRLEAEDGGVSARLLGYSTRDVPRCCPDLVRDVTWLWRDGRLELIPDPAPNSV